MSDSQDGQGGAGRREVAFRLFAAEYDDADRSYSESDEERAPNYVVTPTGARVNRLFVVGVLTEVEAVSDDYLRARVVDPTGPFVVYAGQYQPEAMNFLERADPPLFVAVTGKARTFQPEDSDRVYTSIRPESINEVDADTRDRWVVQAAEQTVDRVARAAEGKLTGLDGEQLTEALAAHGVDDGLASGIPLALDHYGTTGEYLAGVRDLALDAARVVAGERDEVAKFSMAPDDGTDDPLSDLAEHPIDVDAITATADTEEEAPDLSDAPEPDDEPSPTDEEIDDAVASTDLDRADDGAAEGTAVEETVAEKSATDSETERVEDESDTAETDEPTADDVESSADAEGAVAEVESGTTDADESGDEGDATATDETSEETDEAEEIDEFDGEFELDEDERAEIEEEYGTEFQSGSEVDEPGEADIETPSTDPPAEPGEGDAIDEKVDDSADERAEDEQFDAEDTAFDAGESDFDEATGDEASASDGEETIDEDEEVETAGDVALDDAVMDAMADLDDGDGADRDAVVAEVVQSTGADPGEVEDAIQEALMDGRCYEPDDETLKAI